MKGIELCAECTYYNMKTHKCTRGCKIDPDSEKGEDIRFFVDCPLPDVQPVKRCKMIPQKPDCRGYTDTFFCTNCQLHIHLGFIGQRYGGNYCIECGAEVEDGETK